MKFGKRIEKYIKPFQYRLLEKFCAKKQIPVETVNRDGIHKILIIRQHDQLGDFLLSTPVFRAVRQHFPKTVIAVVASSYQEPAARHNMYIDQVITYYKDAADWNWKRMCRFWREIRSGYDLAILLNTVSHSLTSDLVAFFSRAYYILGPDHRLFPGATRNFFYNVIAPYPARPKSQSLCNLDIVRFIGVDTTDASEYMGLLPDERTRAKEYLRGLGWTDKQPLVIIHPGAGKIANRWPVEYFAEAAKQLLAEDQAQIFITWGSMEPDLGDKLLSLLDRSVMSGRFHDIRELAAVLATADLVLCNDTGVMHLAAAVGAPLVAPFGPTDPAEWKPVGDSFVAIRAGDFKTASVKPEQVVAAARKLLNRKS